MTNEWSRLECQSEWSLKIDGQRSSISLPCSHESSAKPNQRIDLFSIEVEGGASNA